MISRRKLIKIVSVSTVATLSGCVTRSMHAGKRSYYDEKVSSILITEDKSTIVAISDRYHYVLASSAHLISILNSPIHKNIEARFTTFGVDDDNSLRGRIDLSAKLQRPEDIEEAVRLGFHNNSRGIKQQIVITGTRYSANNFKNTKTVPLNKEYTIVVSEPEGFAKKAVKIAATPLTVAVDGVLYGALLIFGVPLLVFCLTISKNNCIGRD
ncbi:hypothetical protein QUF74_18855 [Candidatus Halobeggiatoa sp. HSG11]|nr:hypothetical protein [Candidatus Halobeggiatoa sp. HSG11]